MPSPDSIGAQRGALLEARAYPRAVLLTALALLVISAATILGALGFQHIGRYQPCALCLIERIPYYIGAPLAALLITATSLRTPRGLVVLLFGLFTLVMIVSAGLGVYHSGVEWGVWEGPAACAGTGSVGSAVDMLGQLETEHMPSCTEATWRFLWLSFAGWNVVISTFLAALSAAAAAMLIRRAR